MMDEVLFTKNVIIDHKSLKTYLLNQIRKNFQTMNFRSNFEATGICVISGVVVWQGHL